jgi:hypothetical protein
MENMHIEKTKLIPWSVEGISQHESTDACGLHIHKAVRHIKQSKKLRAPG